MAKKTYTAEEVKTDFYLNDTLLQGLVEALREDLTLEATLEIMEDITADTPDITEVETIYRVAHTVKEAYIRGFIYGVDVYRGALEATADGINLEEREVTT